MNMRKKLICFTLVLFCAIGYSHAQNENESGVVAGFFDSSTGQGLDYSAFQLPPLGLLFENAKSNPSVELLAKGEQIQRELIKKERSDLLSFISARAGYTYGVMDNYGTNSDVTTPIYYQYVGSKQHYWNLGVSANIPLDKAWDYKRKIKRQQLSADQASLEKEIAYNELKQRIATLYVRITNNIISLKTAGENAAAYKGAGALTTQEFKLGDATVRELAETKRWENSAIQSYQDLQSLITTDILILEIITNTPIITNVITDKKIENNSK